MKVQTTDVPVDDRFDFWRELADRSHVPTILETDYRGDWDAIMHIHDLGTLNVSTQEHPPSVARRTPRLIRQSDPEHLYLMFPTHGRMAVHQRDRAVEFGADSLVLLDTSLPVTVISPTPTRHFLVNIPRWMLPPRFRTEHLVAAPMVAGRGLGGALVCVVKELAPGGPSYPTVVLSRLTQTVVDLLVAIQLATDGGGTRMPAESRERAKKIQICAYIVRHLADPSLTPARVARAHNISLRQLDRLFQRDGTAPATWVREERLRRCRRDLTDPTQSATPVAIIGARWGYVDPVTFTRAFTRAYGMPPGQYRRQFTPTDHS